MQLRHGGRDAFGMYFGLQAGTLPHTTKQSRLYKFNSLWLDGAPYILGFREKV